MALSLTPWMSRPGGSRPRSWLALGAVSLAVAAAGSGLILFGAAPLVVAASGWWLTAPPADRDAVGPTSVSTAPVAVPDDVKAIAASSAGPPTWPEGRLDGREAKVRLLDLLTVAAVRLNRVATYTATFRKQERLNDRLGPEQTLAMKVRQKPFAVYFKFLEPQPGKEIVYAEGHHDNKLIAHAAGVARFLVPRLAVAPDHPLALTDARHPVTEAGLANLTARLIHFRRADLDDSASRTVMDRTTDADGRAWLRSVHTHPVRHPDRPFARIEVLYDPSTFIPLDIRNYDWIPAGSADDLKLAEHYRYDDLDLGASLTSIDFDPKNPAYAFHRY